MADEPAKFILGDTAISAIKQRPSGRGISKRKNSPPPKSHCENCGAELTGHWCSQCGQAAVDYHRSFRYVIWDVLDALLNWDSKFFATIGLLFAKPWRLTNDFVAGKRVCYFHPLRLYLLASILFFFAVNHWAKSIHLQTGKLTPEQRTEVEETLKEKDLPPVARAAMEKALKNQSPVPGPPASPQQIESPVPKAEASTSPKEDDYGPLLQIDNKEPHDRLGKWLEARAKEKIGEHGSKSELFLATLFQNLPYMMLCCVPLFALVLKILYVRRRVFYINHLIYALHIHSFAYAGIISIIYATIGLNRVPVGLLRGWIIAALWIAFAIQIFLSIRKVYRQGWFFSIFKFFFGGFVYLIVLCFALLATFFVTIALP